MGERFRFKMDPKFIEYYDRRIQQVFLYLIDECQLNCVQCLYKLENNFNIGRNCIEVDQALYLIEDFYELGARKLTLMGGEPTLYGLSSGRIPLFRLIDKAKDLGYEYVRIDTNGQFERSLLSEPAMRRLDEITFSLDGPSAEINDMLRGKGSFDKAVDNIRRAVDAGYNVDVTCCIHRQLIKRDGNNRMHIEEMVYFVHSLGIMRLNFHDLFKGGIPRDYWTGDLDISVDEWFHVWAELQAKIEKGAFPIPIRIPQSFVSEEEFQENPEYFGYCSVKTADRALVHPNGIIRACSLMIGTPYGIASYFGDSIAWNYGYTNESLEHVFDKCTACTNQAKNRSYGSFLPLCVSFKPRQNEFVWNLKLRWEKRGIE
ncbi:MAG: radical SAM protein [Clostridiales bacterium]|jgi:MoaA/NifB/PqqE/SkfB family radical SAM enzyme|nr:radical SAM protein [Clostridiales bacterium]